MGKNRCYASRMPELSRFLGIVIGMFPREHPPPHFHAVYAEYQITVDIRSGVVHGDFPKRALRLVLEWLDLHEDELLKTGDCTKGASLRARRDCPRFSEAGHPAKKIAPLE